jgi:hypothetical protein
VNEQDAAVQRQLTVQAKQPPVQEENESSEIERIHAVLLGPRRAGVWAASDVWAVPHHGASAYLLVPIGAGRSRSLLAAEVIRRRRQSEGELANWKLIKHSETAFNVAAGAFEIEYFNGHTNIRVLDSSRVTIEGPQRGAAEDIIPPGIRPPSYQ